MNLSLPHVLPPVSDPELRFKKYLNLLLALLARREQRAAVHSRPFELTLDLSTRCQLSCPYCSVGNKTIQRQQGFFSPELNAQVLKELGETAFIIWYFSTGEPLLNRRAVECFRLARQYEIFSIISTNLSLKLSDERVDELLQSGVGAICVSLDGATPESYARYRQGGSFDLVLDNLSRLAQRKRALGLDLPLLEWRFLVFRHNETEMQQARDMALSMGVDLIEFFPGYAPPDPPEGEVRACTPGLPIRPTEGSALDRARRRQDTFLHRKLNRMGFSSRETVDNGTPVETLRHQKCDWLYFGTTVFPGGSVGPCCVSNDEPDDFGSLAVAFPEIWNNDRYQAARRMFTGEPHPDLVCARCPNGDAQDYQFRSTLSALLANAPNWVLLALSRAPDRFWWPLDTVLLPREIESLTRLPWHLRPKKDDVLRLRSQQPADEWTGEQIAFLLGLLK
jgi:MoaA/NifB/PqqE/SkfB family radical SAM enzyme